MRRNPEPLPVIECDPVDWAQVLAGVRRAGLSYDNIANEMGMAKSTLMGWSKPGTEPRHCDGERLLELWRIRLGTPVPRRSQIK